MENDLLFDFLADEKENIENTNGFFKILIVDDEHQIHKVTELMLKNFIYDEHKLIFLNAYSADEAKVILKQHSDIAVLLLDVVMETAHAGLSVVKYLREDLKNDVSRIILRTGQPGEAPEDSIIREYDINDYRLKTDMTVERLNTSLYVALRSYSHILRIQNNRLGLEKIIKASSNLFKNNSIEDFFKTILEQLSTFYENPTDLIYIKENKSMTHGFITMEQKETTEIIAGTGKYEKYVGKPLSSVEDLKYIYDLILSHENQLKQVQMIDKGILIKKTGKNTVNNYIFIEGNKFKFDLDLIGIFMTNYSIALDNYMLNNMITKTQSEIIITFANTIEKHFEETGHHIERISQMMYKFALINNFSFSESEVIRIASTMHDIGKVAIPDAILKKPGKLTKEEFEVIKTHPLIGYKILSKSELEIMKVASDIALHHHERYDGDGYPEGLKGKNIPLHARMMAIIDVFDAITHKRIYKKAQSNTVAIDYIKENKNKHFDPDLVDIFLANYEEINDIDE